MPSAEMSRGETFNSALSLASAREPARAEGAIFHIRLSTICKMALLASITDGVFRTLSGLDAVRLIRSSFESE